jgi:hypothetical protein
MRLYSNKLKLISPLALLLVITNIYASPPLSVKLSGFPWEEFKEPNIHILIDNTKVSCLVDTGSPRNYIFRRIIIDDNPNIFQNIESDDEEFYKYVVKSRDVTPIDLYNEVFYMPVDIDEVRVFHPMVLGIDFMKNKVLRFNYLEGELTLNPNIIQHEGTKIPLEINDQKKPIVSTNHGKDLWFLDTGIANYGQMFIIWDDSDKQNSLRFDGIRNYQWAGFNHEEIFLKVLENYEIAGISFDYIPLISVSAEEPDNINRVKLAGVDGILDSQFLRYSDVVFDFVSKQFYVIEFNNNQLHLRQDYSTGFGSFFETEYADDGVLTRVSAVAKGSPAESLARISHQLIFS